MVTTLDWMRLDSEFRVVIDFLRLPSDFYSHLPDPLRNGNINAIVYSPCANARSYNIERLKKKLEEIHTPPSKSHPQQYHQPQSQQLKKGESKKHHEKKEETAKASIMEHVVDKSDPKPKSFADIVKQRANKPVLELPKQQSKKGGGGTDGFTVVAKGGHNETKKGGFEEAPKGCTRNRSEHDESAAENR
jgi:hypothetical protein